MNKTCIIIAGPTAIGKTSLAIEVAKHFSTQIISADSRQCFKELNIGVAKPSPEQLASVHHYFINSHSIQEPVSAAGFEAYALDAVKEIFLKNDIAVMVGGTGLYIKAFCDGLDPIPETNDEIRQCIINSYRQKGLPWLQNEVKQNDPAFFINGEIENPQRLMRALEVTLSTGRSITSFQSRNKKQRDFNIIKIGLELPREELYKMINVRVDQMIDSGLVDEVKHLIPFKELNSLQTVGYRELFAYFDGKVPLEKAIGLIKQNSRHYARRQMTWFKKEEDIVWMNALEGDSLILNTLNAISEKRPDESGVKSEK